MKIIMVHGIWDDGSLFKHLAKHLSQQGYECYIPSLKPSDGKYGLADLAEKLKNYIDSTLDRQTEFIIIGFSMGTLVSRYYLQELEGFKRVKAFFSISGPHNGTLTSFFYFGAGVKDMRPKSQFLCALNANRDCLKDIKLYSYRTPLDLMIFPSRSSILEEAQNIIIWSSFHHLMLKNKRLFKDLSARLKIIQSNAVA